jgi:mono/diheme cytochrome c family protein
MISRLLSLSCIVLISITSQHLPAVEPTSPDVEEPIARWDFSEELPGEKHGLVKIGSKGPAAPVYPDFPSANSALDLQSPSWLSIVDDFEDHRFDFDNGDAVTLEAWVQATGGGDNMYIVSKGRTTSGGPKSINQNWALRLRKVSGQPRLNFLFHSQKVDDSPGEWHRWTSTSGFSLSKRWHHVAVSYKFGDPKSIAGYIDGKPVKGTWDMGGETTRPPVVDDDDIWIGSAMDGNPGNSFHGGIDNIAIHRRMVSADEMKDRFRWDPPAVKPPVIPTDKVLVQLFGPLNNHKVIPEELEPALLEWQQDTFGFVRVPHKYDSWGVRDDWGKTLLIRAWAKVELPVGDVTIMARSRGLSRLTINGQELLTTSVQPNRGGAHHVVDPLPKVQVEGMRPHWMSDSERSTTYASKGGEHLVLFEMIVGGGGYRVEFGEACVAINQGDEMFHLLSSTSNYPLTDSGWFEFAGQQSEMLRLFDLSRRRTANAIRRDYWTSRHQYAKGALLASPKLQSIDQLIASRIVKVNEQIASAAPRAAENTENVAFYDKHVLPILTNHCARCHRDKEKGGFSIRSRERLLAGGDSGDGVIPGDSAKSYLFEMITASDDDARMPPKGDGLDEKEIETIRSWIDSGAEMPAKKLAAIELNPIADDYTFLRRVFIDVLGVPPTLAEAREFLNDEPKMRRRHVIDRLLKDDRWADNWVGYWQDVLAENPNLLKPTLNNTGPFRWWIHEALVDNKPIDRFATELIMMRGSKWYGGSAGFAVASQNDVPMAAKAHVVGSAFLGVNMKCARCHDAPYHDWKQSDLFQLAAMMDRRTLTLPGSSTVPAAFFQTQQRKPLIDATIRAGAKLEPKWPFPEIAGDVPEQLLDEPNDTRERLAMQVTSSRRFAAVIANRMWKRFMGAGLVEPVDDWEGNPPSDPALLAALTDQLIVSDYNVKELTRVILNSQAYQRVANADEIDADRYFAGPYRRRMTAEQIVDSAFHTAGVEMDTEPLTMDIEGTLPADKFLNFGRPKHAWEFTTLANERDRPSLALPRIQAVADVLKAFGWRNSRPEPTSEREERPNLIQPGVLANGTLGVWLTRLSDQSQLTHMALEDQPIETFVDDLFLRLLTRPPTPKEREQYLTLLSPGYSSRVVPRNEIGPAPQKKRFRYVSWSNHLNTEANKIKVEQEKVARIGDPPTRFLRDDWRQRAEDAVWALMNSPEMVLIP